MTNNLVETAFESYSKENSIKKLQIGCGSNYIDGWFNTDIEKGLENIHFLDTSERFPFNNNSFERIFSEHHIEHLDYQSGFFTISECLRVLKPNGILRIATPDIEKILHLVSSKSKEQSSYISYMFDRFVRTDQINNPIFVINNAFYNWGHKFLYNMDTISRMLRKMGFIDIERVGVGQSKHEYFASVEKHGVFLENEEINRFETMVIEARKP